MVSIDELHNLAEISARIGGNPLLVQGPGGNTSVKSDSELWVKASGFWLAEALDRQIFVPLDMGVLAQSSSDGETPPEAVLSDRNPGSLRPSIETALHALMPHRAVVHAHAVNAMAASMRGDGRRFAEERLAPLAWDWIEYRRPGAPLAQEVARVLQERTADILLLQNHGVVIGADTMADAERLLAEVEERLAVAPRPLGSANLDPVRAWEDARFEVHAAASAVALDSQAVGILSGKTLIPDQIVFLGGAVPLVGPGESLNAVVDAHEARTGVVPALVLIEGKGALALRARSDAADALIGGLLEIVRRLPGDVEITGLGIDAVEALSNWDAEAHRRALDAERNLGA